MMREDQDEACLLPLVQTTDMERRNKYPTNKSKRMRE
jgi:hypothetical protein